MSKGLNKVMLIGRVGDVPELRHTPNGRAVTTFSISTPRTWTSPEGERHEELEWFHVVAWGSLAEQCHQSLLKGQLVYVEGRLQTRGWEDSSGRQHFRTEVIAKVMVDLSDSTEY
jgi:single-strand DNA-binding protein